MLTVADLNAGKWPPPSKSRGRKALKARLDVRDFRVAATSNGAACFIAKHLLHFYGKEIRQIRRSAQDDIIGGFFRRRGFLGSRLEFLVDGLQSPDLKLSGAVGRGNLYAVTHPLSHQAASYGRRGRDQTLAEVRLLGGN